MINTVGQFPISTVFQNDNKKIYRIPKYQREYIWSVNNWDSLFDDVTDNESGYFLGSYICVSMSSMEIPELEIIDGQQRFTSIVLLLTALYTKLLEHKNADEMDEDRESDVTNLKKMIANREDKKGKEAIYTPKLILQDQNDNRVDFESILADNNIIGPRKSPKYRGVRRIEKAFKHFGKCIDDYVEERKENDPELTTVEVLFELADKFKAVVLVGIEVDNHKDAYMLFESLNHRGVPLSAIDLIKNILIAEADGKGEADECYTQWTECLAEMGDDYAVQERFFRQYYNAYREELNEPFQSGATSKRYPLAYKATRTTLLDIYEKLIHKDYEKFMGAFVHEAAIYSVIVNNSDEKHVYDDALKDLERIQGAPSYLLLLYLLTEQERLGLNDDDITEIVVTLVSFFARRNITDIPATRNLDRIFMDIIEKIKNETGHIICNQIVDALKNESASEEIFDTKLRGPVYDENDTATRFLLCGIESKHQTREIYSDLWTRNTKGTYTWTIEHIFPEGENIPDDWVDMIAGGDSDKAKEYRGEYVHTLGNLTLTGYNPTLSNLSFEKKKDRKDKSGEKEVGYKNGLFLNKDVVTEDEWTIDKIKERTDKLVEIIKQIYSW